MKRATVIRSYLGVLGVIARVRSNWEKFAVRVFLVNTKALHKYHHIHLFLIRLVEIHI